MLKCSRAAFASVCNTLTCSLSKGVLKQYLLDSGLTNSFTVFNFPNKVVMKIIFFLKMFKIWCIFQKWNERVRNSFFVWKIIVFESGTTNFQNPEQDIYHWQTMCYKTPVRFNITLSEIFSKSGTLRVMKK